MLSVQSFKLCIWVSKMNVMLSCECIRTVSCRYDDSSQKWRSGRAEAGHNPPAAEGLVP